MEGNLLLFERAAFSLWPNGQWGTRGHDSITRGNLVIEPRTVSALYETVCEISRPFARDSMAVFGSV